MGGSATGDAKGGAARPGGDHGLRLHGRRTLGAAPHAGRGLASGQARAQRWTTDRMSKLTRSTIPRTSSSPRSRSRWPPSASRVTVALVTGSALGAGGQAASVRRARRGDRPRRARRRRARRRATSSTPPALPSPSASPSAAPRQAVRAVRDGPLSQGRLRRRADQDLVPARRDADLDEHHGCRRRHDPGDPGPDLLARPQACAGTRWRRRARGLGEGPDEARLRRLRRDREELDRRRDPPRRPPDPAHEPAGGPDGLAWRPFVGHVGLHGDGRPGASPTASP